VSVLSEVPVELLDLTPIVNKLSDLHTDMRAIIGLLTEIRDENRERFRRLHPREHQASEAAKHAKARQ
jgi:hypothetical protein